MNWHKLQNNGNSQFSPSEIHNKNTNCNQAENAINENAMEDAVDEQWKKTKVRVTGSSVVDGIYEKGLSKNHTE